MVLAELDSVLDSFHHNQSANTVPKQQLTMNSSGGSSSGGGSKSSKKKQRSSKLSASDKQSHHNHTEPIQPHPVKAGVSAGTWPRTRGGPIIDQGTGTILHPQKMKKERLPLSELLNNLPKYPPDKKQQQQGKGMVEGIHRTAEVVGRSSTRRIAQRPLTTYGVIDITEQPSTYR